MNVFNFEEKLKTKTFVVPAALDKRHFVVKSVFHKESDNKITCFWIISLKWRIIVSYVGTYAMHINKEISLFGGSIYFIDFYLNEIFHIYIYKKL